MSKTRVIAAMSGGVDSAYAASVLHEQGYEVIGVTLKLHECGTRTASPSCCGTDSITKARSTALTLGIRHYVHECVAEFQELVLKTSWEEYSSGRTPSPCLLCNERVKFGLLMDFADRLGATHIATGHYSSIETDPDGTSYLLRGADRNKDQSYFLAGLTQDQLKRIIFPLGQVNKSEVRAYTASKNLPSAGSPESQDACLTGDFNSFSEMLKNRFNGEDRTGTIEDEEGTVLGKHKGLHSFTIGQRKGLGLGTHKPLWVKDLCTEKNTVIVTDSPENLLHRTVRISGLTVPEKYAVRNHFPCEAQIRYRQKPQKAEVSLMPDGRAVITFESPVSAAAPGQAAVIYDGNRVLGRGWIEETA